MNERIQIRVVGAVQGVGFRPFVYRLATELELGGWVINDSQGVTIEAEGPHARLLEFLQRLQEDKPAPAILYALDHRFVEPVHESSFEIRQSESAGSTLAWILPDLGTCGDCVREIFDPENRRFRYPFTNCTNCGTRFTIIDGLPYDRPLTAMRGFQMCERCSAEYIDPQDRRFHAQPNACAECGPKLEAHSDSGRTEGEQALEFVTREIQQGRIIALKGLGGFHLIVDARNEAAVCELRRRKRRQNKPFAVMYPGFPFLKRHVHVPRFAEPLLLCPQAPILLLERMQAGFDEIAPSVAPFSPYLGVFLPYTPLHHLLLKDLDFPVVATSGNLTDDPIQFEDRQAFETLGSLCDTFLVHDRPILHHADDSVMQIVQKPVMKTQMLRRARGYTPLPVLASRPLPPLLALGGHLNLTFALSRGNEIILSQHLGDLEGYESREVYRKALDDFLQLYDVKPITVVHDLHPDYFTTHLAQQFDLPRIAVQHHHAHMAACMLENRIEGRVLGVTWDGTGYGPDHTVWGGEFLTGSPESYIRFASLFPFRLPGGEKAIKQPWRTALSLLYEVYGPEAARDLPLFSQIAQKDVDATFQMLQKRVLSPVTSSMGRLFDGVSALLGLSYYNTHQAESAQLLEYAAWRHGGDSKLLPVSVIEEPVLRIDWRPMIRELLDRFRNGQTVEHLAASFHHAVKEAALIVAQRAGEEQIVMAGGVFCNRYLTESLLTRLQEAGFRAFIHSQLPPTDGSLSAGQLWVAAHTTG